MNPEILAAALLVRDLQEQADRDDLWGYSTFSGSLHELACARSRLERLVGQQRRAQMVAQLRVAG